MSYVTRSLLAALARFEHDARYEHRLSRSEIAAELIKLRQDGREHAREQLLAHYG